MLLKILIFNGDDRVPQDFGKIIVGSQDAPLQGERANDFAGVVIQLGDGAGPVVLQLADLRQIGGVNHQEASQRAHQGRSQHQEAEHYPAHQLFSAHLHSREI